MIQKVTNSLSEIHRDWKLNHYRARIRVLTRYHEWLLARAERMMSEMDRRATCEYVLQGAKEVEHYRELLMKMLPQTGIAEPFSGSKDQITHKESNSITEDEDSQQLRSW